MTNVSMERTTAEKFDLTESFGCRGSHINRVLASVQLPIGFELCSGADAALPAEAW